MIVYPSLPSGHTVFCDDIRHEIGGKLSLMGIYDREIIVRKLPITLPKFCMVVTINEKVSSVGQRKIKVIFESDDFEEENEKVLLEMEYQVPDDVVAEETEEFVMRSNRLELVAAPYKLEHPGKIKVRMYQDGDEIRLGAIMVKLDQIPADEDAKI